MKSEDKIGGLFKDTLRGNKEAISLEEIEQMSQVILNSNFYNLDLKYFNIYYASAIVSGFLITIFLAGHFIYTQSNSFYPSQLERRNNFTIKNKPENLIIGANKNLESIKETNDQTTIIVKKKKEEAFYYKKD